MVQGQRCGAESIGPEKSRLDRNSAEIIRRASVLAVEHQRLDLELETFRVSADAGLQRSDDLKALQDYVARRKAADLRIHNGYSDPGHPYWGYKCAEYGIETFNRRILCPSSRMLGFVEAYSGCFCTKYKTHMLDGWSKPEELVSLVEHAQRIGYPYEVVFVLEGQEAAVERLKATGVVKEPRIILWMNPMLDDPPREERKEAVKARLGINAIGSDDMGALFFTPNESGGSVDLPNSLTGLDMWMDLVRKDNIVRIKYLEEMYRPPLKLIPTKG
jgi:hypothetical protein